MEIEIRAPTSRVVPRTVIAAAGTDRENFLQTTQVVIFPHRNHLLVVVHAEQMLNRQIRVLFPEYLQKFHGKIEVRLDQNGNFSVFFYSFTEKQLQNCMPHMHCAPKGNLSATPPPFNSSFAISASWKIYSFFPSRQLNVSISSPTDLRR